MECINKCLNGNGEAMQEIGYINNKPYCKECLNTYKLYIEKPNYAIKGLDCSITLIKEEWDLKINEKNKPIEDKTKTYFISEVSIFDSLGEMGYNYTELWDIKPTYEEIIKKTKEHLKEEFKRLNDEFLTAREENYLKAIRKIRKQLI